MKLEGVEILMVILLSIACGFCFGAAYKTPDWRDCQDLEAIVRQISPEELDRATDRVIATRLMMKRLLEIQP